MNGIGGHVVRRLADIRRGRIEGDEIDGMALAFGEGGLNKLGK